MADMKKAVGAVAVAGLLYAAYRVVIKKETPLEAVQETIQKPVEITKEVIEKAQEILSDIVAEVKPEGKPAENDHKGHETTKGLSQDQQLISSESWEESYQRVKAKSKRKT